LDKCWELVFSSQKATSTKSAFPSVESYSVLTVSYRHSESL
jgi:hypothetical protein